MFVIDFLLAVVYIVLLGVGELIKARLTKHNAGFMITTARNVLVGLYGYQVQRAATPEQITFKAGNQFVKHEAVRRVVIWTFRVLYTVGGAIAGGTIAANNGLIG